MIFKVRLSAASFCPFHECVLFVTGTASVAVAGLLAAVKMVGKPLTENKIMFLGAGEVWIPSRESASEFHGRFYVLGCYRYCGFGLYGDAGMIRKALGSFYMPKYFFLFRNKDCR